MKMVRWLVFCRKFNNGTQEGAFCFFFVGRDGGGVGWWWFADSNGGFLGVPCQLEYPTDMGQF